MDTHVKNRQMEREHFMWWLVEGTSLDAASTEAGRELVELAKSSGASRRYREGCIYALLEGLSRRVGMLDEKILKAMPGGKDLVTLAKACKANARYAQLRIQWVDEDTFTWNEIEQSEEIQLEQSVLRKHKTGKLLSRDKLKRLMQETRESFLEQLSKSRKGTTTGSTISASKFKSMKLQITQMQKKLTKKRPGGLFGAASARVTKKGKGTRGGTNKPFCEWCKRAGRTHLIYHHDSKDCNKKPPNG